MDDNGLHEWMRVARKFREFLRDMLYMKYGDKWRDREWPRGKFFSAPDERDTAIVHFLAAYAEADEKALKVAESLKVFRD